MTVGKSLAISTCVVLGLLRGPLGACGEEAARSAQELESAVDQLQIAAPRLALRPPIAADTDEQDSDDGGLVTLHLKRSVDKPIASNESVADASTDEAAATDQRTQNGEEAECSHDAASESAQVASPTDETDPDDADVSAAAAAIDSAAVSDEPAASTTVDPAATESPSGEKPVAASSPREQSPRMVALRDKIHRVLSYYYRQSLNTRDHNPWEMMHGVIAYGCDTKIHLHGPQGQRVNGISYLSTNAPCHGVRLMYLDGKKRLNVQIGQYVQGHAGQLMAILAQCHLPIDYPIQFEGRKFTMRDLIDTEMKTCEPNSELTFKLIGFSHYLDTETIWLDEHGRKWSIPRLIHEEIRQPILNTAACGGTHRLMGLSYCNYTRAKEGRPIEGEYKRAKLYIQDYHKYAFALQNPDGSFSTDWFKSRQNKPDIDRKLKTTGHILEWLAFSLPEDQLTNPRMVRAVDFIATILDEGRGRKWEIGPIGHSLHALRIYDRRQFPAPTETPTPPPAAPLAQTPAAAPDATAGDATATASAPDASSPDAQPSDTPRVAQRPMAAEPASDDPFDGPSPAEAEDLFSGERGSAESNGPTEPVLSVDGDATNAAASEEETEVLATDDATTATASPESIPTEAMAPSTAETGEAPAEPAIRVRPILPGTTDARAPRRIRAGPPESDRGLRNSLRAGATGPGTSESFVGPPPIPTDPNDATAPQPAARQPAAPRRGVDNSLRTPMRRRVR